MNRQLEGKSWAFVTADNWMIHLCPVWLLDDLEKDMVKRQGKPISYGEAEGIDRIWWDPGGMVMVDRSKQELDIDSATLQVASQNFEEFLSRLEELKVRTFEGGKQYYKLHGWPCHCLVFTPEQRELILTTWKAILPTVRKVAEIEDAEFLRRLRSINSDGIKVISVKDPDVKIEQKEDGTVSVKVRQELPGPLSGTPSNAKN